MWYSQHRAWCSWHKMGLPPNLLSIHCSFFVSVFENWMNNEYWIIRFLKIDWILNTNSTIQVKFLTKRRKKSLILIFCSYMKHSTVFFIHIMLYENSITIRYSLTAIRVFEYLEITNGLNMNSTIWSPLFEYQIIQIIRCNSVEGLVQH